MYLDFCKVFERAFHERKRERIFLELGIGEVFTSQTGPGSRRDSARSSLPSLLFLPIPLSSPTWPPPLSGLSGLDLLG